MYNSLVDTRTRLVEATQGLLWERGYAATSPKDIQARACAGQGSMYHHFDGKQDLAVVALERSAEKMRSDTETLLSAPGTALQRLAGYLRGQRDSLGGCRMGRMTYDADVVESPSLLKPVAGTLTWAVESIARVVSLGVESGEFPPATDPTAVASTVVAVVQGGYVLARAEQDHAAFEAAIEGAIAMLEGWAAQ